MCTSPFLRIRYKYFPDKNNLVDIGMHTFSSWDPSRLGFSFIKLSKAQSKFDSYADFKRYIDTYCDYQYIDCGHCDECRAHYSRDWAVRCFCEYVTSDCSCFLTLTVDSSKVYLFNERIEKSFDGVTNVQCKRCIKGNMCCDYPVDYSLNKFIVLDFIRRLRDYLYREKKITFRYFGCGEYGEQNDRPHYHILIFGYDFLDRVLWEISKSGYKVFMSEELSKFWKYGIATVQDVEIGTCLYTSQYCLKKIKPCLSNYDGYIDQYYGRVPEFIFMSKGNCQANRCQYIDNIISDRKLNSLRNLNNPYCKNCNKTRGGIGFEYLRRYWNDIVKLGFLRIDGKRYPIPKYFLKVIKLTSPEIYDSVHLKTLHFIDELESEDNDNRSIERLSARDKIRRQKRLMKKRNLS